MRRHLTNAMYGVLDYASYPFGMLLVAPIVIHKLGAAEYGLWMIATSVISAGGIIASGFCDACVQRVAQLRAASEKEWMVHTVRSMLGIGLILGLVLAVLVWVAAPYAARSISVSNLSLQRECLISLRIASLLILVRGIESVGVSVHRAFESYSGTVKISTAVRLLTLISAGALATTGHRTISILAVTAVFLVGGTYLQFRQLSSFLGAVSLWPVFQPKETRFLLGLGIFVWLQALGGVVFGQFDRIFLGVSSGALAVAPYALCIQFAQPLFGLTASGLHFLFPYLSGRAHTISPAALRQTLLKALACNLLLVASGAGLLLAFGDRLLRAWAGPAIAQTAIQIFPPIVLGSALMGLSVTGTYALQALGLFRVVAFFSLGGRAALLVLMIYLMHHMGLRGLATSRVCYGVVALLVYLPLFRVLRKAAAPLCSAISMSNPPEFQERSTS
jgi:O-antigen/teichoic acid export membrane protein